MDYRPRPELDPRSLADSTEAWAWLETIDCSSCFGVELHPTETKEAATTVANINTRVNFFILIHLSITPELRFISTLFI